jgi:hypothetical protein
MNGPLSQDLIMLFNVARRNMPHSTLHAHIRKCALVRPLTSGSQPGKWGTHVKSALAGVRTKYGDIIRQSFMQRTSQRS